MKLRKFVLPMGVSSYRGRPRRAPKRTSAECAEMLGMTPYQFGAALRNSPIPRPEAFRSGTSTHYDPAEVKAWWDKWQAMKEAAK